MTHTSNIHMHLGAEHGGSQRAHYRQATARTLGIGIVAYGVVAHGLLNDGPTLAALRSDAGWPNSRYSGENLKTNLEMIKALETVAVKKSISLSQLALAWVLSRGEDVLPMVGMSRRSRRRRPLLE
jgi:aryl-alcohol dehydrogenase-like predicted oxidoreductase